MHRLLLYDTNRNIIGLRCLFSAADESDLKLQNKKFREGSSETKVTNSKPRSGLTLAWRIERMLNLMKEVLKRLRDRTEATFVAEKKLTGIFQREGLLL